MPRSRLKEEQKPTKETDVFEDDKSLTYSSSLCCVTGTHESLLDFIDLINVTRRRHSKL